MKTRTHLISRNESSPSRMRDLCKEYRGILRDPQHPISIDIQTLGYTDSIKRVRPPQGKSDRETRFTRECHSIINKIYDWASHRIDRQTQTDLIIRTYEEAYNEPTAFFGAYSEFTRG